ncbi:hypothetical protein [Streptomyces sp. NPDC004976]
MTAIVRLLAVLLGATSSEAPMSRLLAFDEAAFAGRVRDRRRPASVGHNAPAAGHARAHAGVSA